MQHPKKITRRLAIRLQEIVKGRRNKCLNGETKKGKMESQSSISNLVSTKEEFVERTELYFEANKMENKKKDNQFSHKN